MEMNKKLIVAAALSLLSSLSFANCWQNGKYVMCPKQGVEAPAAKATGDQPVGVNGCWRNGKYVMCRGA